MQRQIERFTSEIEQRLRQQAPLENTTEVDLVDLIPHDVQPKLKSMLFLRVWKISDIFNGLGKTIINLSKQSVGLYQEAVVNDNATEKEITTTTAIINLPAIASPPRMAAARPGQNPQPDQPIEVAPPVEESSMVIPELPTPTN